jgi:hypothetical protein
MTLDVILQQYASSFSMIDMNSVTCSSVNNMLVDLGSYRAGKQKGYVKWEESRTNVRWLWPNRIAWSGTPLTNRRFWSPVASTYKKVGPGYLRESLCTFSSCTKFSNDPRLIQKGVLKQQEGHHHRQHPTSHRHGLHHACIWQAKNSSSISCKFIY